MDFSPSLRKIALVSRQNKFGISQIFIIIAYIKSVNYNY